MAATSSIEWTDASWNPVTGCDEVSPGCDHCYAKTFAERFRGVPGHPYEQGFDLKLWPDRLDLPRRWKKPRRIFVNSMSDLFHKDVPDAYIRDVFHAMMDAPQHTYQVLTKRPKRMARWFERFCGIFPHNNIPAYIWMGTSIENDAYTWRADYLRKVRAVRFVSAEPLLSALPSLNLSGLHWLIAGGESGHGARPCWPSWIEDLRDRCTNAGVAFFFKQWGEYEPYEEDAQPPFWNDQHGRCIDGHALDIIDSESGGMGKGWHEESLHSPYAFRRVGKHAAGRLLDGREWNEMPV